MLIGGRFLPLSVRAQQQVFPHGQLVPPIVLAEQGGVLKNLLGIQRLGWSIAEEHAARGGGSQPEKSAHQRSFPRTAGTDQGHHLPAFYMQVHVVQRGCIRPGIGDAQIAYSEFARRITGCGRIMMRCL